MPIVTCSETVSWARAACGVPVGRYIDEARLEDGLLDPVGRVHLPLLARRRSGSTNTSWVSEWTAKPCEPGGVR